ncbi:antitoxin (DNA-binding transcriptional repressor) of toxin-antitoxin stability system [Neorhizobium huautlense]|uniref:Antitoxin n=1 Tax=Neorhizobium huautlense TaxID=67774 RepID=A0ABT9PR65_9HYPH|nr:type II toxin-antitoxin system prevent-host-death family antitoxin [Neorhizobium huautlense]MDP9836954.1 antitoxin (DNA-binding transcriptional repressor) of toxin-antitoxin stability system [Neorhizobium huautlense]
MATVSVAEAQEKLGELIDRVARGETVEIVRDGKPVATLKAPERKPEPARRKEPVDLERLKAIRDQMPVQIENAGEFMRKVRDGERY